ncbi:MAG: hypothetical protein Q2484_17140 [Candidatus Sedimenticola sp. (ex Thyasira tokunagai)]
MPKSMEDFSPALDVRDLKPPTNTRPLAEREELAAALKGIEVEEIEPEQIDEE